MSPLIACLALLLSAAVVSPAAAVPAEPPPRELIEGIFDTIPVRVQVTYVDPSGAVMPAAGAIVRLERFRRGRPGMDEAPEVVHAWVATATQEGTVLFENLTVLGTAEVNQLVVRWKDSETVNALEPPNDGRIEPLSVVVRKTIRDLSRLEMSLRLALTPRDSGMQVEHLIDLENPTHAIIDTDQGAGLVLPLVTPAPFDEPIASFLPQRPEGREFLTQLEPESGRVLVEKGRLVFRGPVPPEGQQLRVVYLIPYAGATSHTYGLRMPLPARPVSLVLRSPESVVPAVSFRAPSEVLVRPSGEGEVKTILTRHRPRAGEVVLIDVVGTPERHSFMRPLAAGLGAVVVALLVGLAAGRKRRA